ncbi:hypothetical protein D9M71_771610 [compost metagenome]
MEQDHFLLRVRRGTVGVLATFLLRQVAVLPVQPRLDRLGKGFEAFNATDLKTAEENAGMLDQLALDLVAMLVDPLNQVDARVRGFHHQGEALRLQQPILAHAGVGRT